MKNKVDKITKMLNDVLIEKGNKYETNVIYILKESEVLSVLEKIENEI